MAEKNGADPELRLQMKEFFGGGFFDWQFTHRQHLDAWTSRRYDEEKYWGGFSREQPPDELPAWAIGGFSKRGRPVLSPSPDGWDCGHFGGGVHNGALLVKDGRLWYIYRGEFPLAPDGTPRKYPELDYLCDIGAAVSDDGRSFTKITDGTPFFRTGGDERYSFEDVNIVSHDGTYYMFLNRWDWENLDDTSVCGAFLATSRDLLHWEKHGIIFPRASRTHRNPCVLSNVRNEAVRDAEGRFVMYLNDGLVAYSRDLLHWEPRDTDGVWPGGEGCFALADFHKDRPDDILLFTGGHHTGHFYAVGEVLLSKKAPGKPVDWLMRPVLSANPEIPWENGMSDEAEPRPVSYWRDTVFFTGMTEFRGKLLLTYGGSEYYTCIAEREI